MNEPELPDMAKQASFDVIRDVVAAERTKHAEGEAVADKGSAYHGSRDSNRSGPNVSIGPTERPSSEHNAVTKRGHSLENKLSDFDLMNVVEMRASQNRNEDTTDTSTKANRDSKPEEGEVGTNNAPDSFLVPAQLQAQKGGASQKKVQPQLAEEWSALYQSGMVQPMPEETDVATASNLSGRPLQSEPGAYSGSSMRRMDKLNFSLVGNPAGQPGTRLQNSLSPVVGDMDATARTEHSGEATGLVVANMVCESSKKILGQAEAYDNSTRTEVETQRRKTGIVVAISSFCLIVIGLVVALVFLLPSRRSSTPDSKASSPQAQELPSPAPSLSTPNFLLSLFPEDTQQAILESPNSPQAVAFEWLLEDVATNLLSDERIKQRFALATFYFATSGPQWFRNAGWLDHSIHECQWYSAGSWREDEGRAFKVELAHNSSCELDPREPLDMEEAGNIQHIWLQHNNVDGELPPEFFNQLMSLRSIMLDGCSVQGVFPLQFGTLAKLEVLSLMETELEGTLPTPLFQTSLRKLAITNNRLSGTIPTEVGLATS